MPTRTLAPAAVTLFAALATVFFHSAMLCHDVLSYYAGGVVALGTESALGRLPAGAPASATGAGDPPGGPIIGGAPGGGAGVGDGAGGCAVVSGSS